ncbi:MAG: hypothetical protein KDC92_13045, partial [Bacteroidetes bacterium]|nr:hypothetical protein [Bacteroidota bacterium]
LKKRKLKSGDRLVISDQEYAQLAAAVIMVAIVAYFRSSETKGNSRKHSDSILKSLFSDQMSNEEVEIEIERMYGISIEYDEHGIPKELKNSSDQSAFQNWLLNGPTMSDEQFKAFNEHRNSFNNWPN